MNHLGSLVRRLKKPEPDRKVEWDARMTRGTASRRGFRGDGADGEWNPA